MNDDEMPGWLRDLVDPACYAADRIEALLAEVAGLRAERGRVPVSWDECADWLDAGFDVAGIDAGNARFLTRYSAADFRANVPTLNGMVLSDYRLLPPPGLVAAPSGMDGGGFLGAGADVPDGWPWRLATNWDFQTTDRCHWGHTIVQCRPPVRPAERAVVEVPLTQLVGRVIEGYDKPSDGHPSYDDVFDNWMWRNGTSWMVIPSHTLDLATGRVRVYAEGDA